MSTIEEQARDWLATLEDIASQVDEDDESTRMTQFEQNLLTTLRRHVPPLQPDRELGEGS